MTSSSSTERGSSYGGEEDEEENVEDDEEEKDDAQEDEADLVDEPLRGGVHDLKVLGHENIVVPLDHLRRKLRQENLGGKQKRKKKDLLGEAESAGLDETSRIEARTLLFLILTPKTSIEGAPGKMPGWG